MLKGLLILLGCRIHVAANWPGIPRSAQHDFSSTVSSPSSTCVLIALDLDGQKKGKVLEHQDFSCFEMDRKRSIEPDDSCIPAKRRRTSTVDEDPGTNMGIPPSSSSASVPAVNFFPPSSLLDTSSSPLGSPVEELDVQRNPLSTALDFLDDSPKNVARLDRVAALGERSS